VVNLVMHRPELVRSWASDIVGLFDPDYVWHDLAQVWQTPGEGEHSIETLPSGTVQDRAAQMATLGIPMDIATSIAAAQGPESRRPHGGARRPGALVWRKPPPRGAAARNHFWETLGQMATCAEGPALTGRVGNEPFGETTQAGIALRRSENQRSAHVEVSRKTRIYG
jgi:hypothetical protein